MTRLFELQKVPARGLKLHMALAQMADQHAAAETAAILDECPDLRTRLVRRAQGQGRIIPLAEVAARYGVQL